MRTTLLSLLVLLTVFTISLTAQEQFDLTTPESQGQPDRTLWRVEQIHFIFERNGDQNEVRIVLLDNNGVGLGCRYSGDNTSTAHSDMVTLNKADLSSNSLQRRILNRLTTVGGTDPDLADGGPCLPSGMVTGVPQ